MDGVSSRLFTSVFTAGLCAAVLSFQNHRDHTQRATGQETNKHNIIGAIEGDGHVGTST